MYEERVDEVDCTLWDAKIVDDQIFCLLCAVARMYSTRVARASLL